MKTRSQTGFAALQTEGAILPADLLRRISEGDGSLGGMEPGSFHLPAGERVSEAVSRSWSRLQGSWAAFQAGRSRLADTDTGTTLTREKWLLPLFQELGFGRLTAAKPVVIGEKTYALSHGWQHAPIHLLSFRLDLDKRQPGAVGASKSSPHSLVQELLNRSNDHLWGFLTNGLRLRILRDNASLSRQAFVEFDLEAIFDGELYADFALLWLLCHQSRIEGEKPDDCWLEKWSRAAKEQGTRALDRLRAGVEEAITALGTGLLAHPANGTLRDRLQAGTCSRDNLYRELLRHVYRLLFLFVAEDRHLLHPPGTTADARERYDRFFSTQRLRRLALRSRGTRHADLFATLRLVVGWLGSDEGRPEVGLPALGSFLFDASAVPETGSCQVANRHVLAAVRALAYTTDRAVTRAVDYRNLGAEELGSVYESLLELRPSTNVRAGTFSLETTTGHERKTTGSYYTHDALVACLLDKALEPILTEAAHSPDPEAALLAIKVCDPACGSGHFLIAAAHRIARRVAAVRTSDEEPAPDAVRVALREVAGRCIYGVDINPMAVELCRVSLWVDALDPGRPLSFLDHHIQCGNALIGASADLLRDGIPDAAFEAVEGDDKRFVASLKRQNKLEKDGAQSLFSGTEHFGRLIDECRSAITALNVLAEDSAADIRAKEATWIAFQRSGGFATAKTLADLWCAVFFWPKSNHAPVQAPTEETLRRGEQDLTVLSPRLLDEVRRLASTHSFFHWHLAFPDVFSAADGGFDAILGNPPWDTLSPDQREFFGQYHPDMRSLGPEEQEAVIARLLSDASIASAWTAHCRGLYGTVHFLKRSGRYSLYAPGNLGKGDFNVYRSFVELGLQTTRRGGTVAMIVPAGLYGGANASAIRKHLLDECQFQHLWGLSNSKRGWFKDVDMSRFAAFSARRGGRTEDFTVQFGLFVPEDLTSNAIVLSADDIRQQDPETYAIQEVRSATELAVSRRLYPMYPAFGDKAAGPPARHYHAEIHMGNDRERFTTDPEGLPLYEGRMVGQFDHRAKTYVSGHGNSSVWKERPFGDPMKAIVPQWRVLRREVPSKLGDRVDHYRIGFRDVAQPRDERSLIASLIPPGTICGDKVPTLDFGWGFEWAYLPWLAVANSFVMDWLARARLSSAKMGFTLVDGLPFPRVRREDSIVASVAPIVLRLVCTAPEMTPFWNQMAALYDVAPCPEESVPSTAYITEEARAIARAQLDVIVARDVFQLSKAELSDILDMFPALKRREEKEVGEFRTKRLILSAYGQKAGAARAGKAATT